MKKSSLFIVCLLIFSASFSQQLMINEVSQGSGTSEYVEFIVVGSPICEGDPVPCIDIRKVIFDDNNGFFQTGSGTGIAAGALRFSNADFWSCIPQGTTIIIYNNLNRNNSIPNDDNSIQDGNCIIILPGNSPLLESTSVSPNLSNSLYPPDSDWVPSTGWGGPTGTNGVSMSNSNDSFQIPNLGQNGTPLHSLSWGNNSNGAIIYFTGPVSDQVISFKNIVSNDYTSQQNWIIEDIVSGETPGLPNSPENNYWIGTMNPSCRALPVINISATNATCGVSNGTASVDTSSMVGNAQILWNNGLTSSTISNLAAGVYSVTVIDELGCTFEESIAVNDNNAPVVSSTIVDETCPNSCNGSITLNVSGGQTPYSFTWSSNVLNTNGSSATNLCSDSYTATITDANGCNANVIETINSSLSFDVIMTSTLSTCGTSTGSATATIIGGSGNFSYQWGATAGNQTTQTATNLSSGIHEVTVTDLTNNCQVSENVLVSNESGIQTSVTKTPTTCASECNGSASIVAIGGSGAYTYLWDSNAGSQTTANVNNLCVGNFTCTVSDNAGCSTMISVTISGPQAISTSEQITATTCSNICDGGLTVSATGGLAPYTTNVYDEFGNQVGQSNLCVGNYVVTVSDASSCESTPKNIIVSTSNLIDFTKSLNQVVCANESLDISVFVLSSGSVLTWDDGSTVNTKSITPSINTNYPFEIVSGVCTLKDTIKIDVIDCTEDSSLVVLPNIFTPDGDSKNDFYVPLILKNVTVQSFVILNRWGNVMIEFKDNNIKWDGKTEGKDATDGTYFYIITYKDISDVSSQAHGFIQLIRK